MGSKLNTLLKLRENSRVSKVFIRYFMIIINYITINIQTLEYIMVVNFLFSDYF